MNHLTTHKHRVSGIENLVIYVLKGASTIVEDPRQRRVNLYKSALFMQNKANLRKAKMDAKLIIAVVYRYFGGWEQRKNKANQSQFRGSARACAELVEGSAIWPDEEEVVFSLALVARPVILNAKVGSVHNAAHTDEKHGRYLWATPRRSPRDRQVGRSLQKTRREA
jgi:hypothetical protein